MKWCPWSCPCFKRNDFDPFCQSCSNPDCNHPLIQQILCNLLKKSYVHEQVSASSESILIRSAKLQVCLIQQILCHILMKWSPWSCQCFERKNFDPFCKGAVILSVIIPRHKKKQQGFMKKDWGIERIVCNALCSRFARSVMRSSLPEKRRFWIKSVLKDMAPDSADSSQSLDANDMCMRPW